MRPRRVKELVPESPKLAPFSSASKEFADKVIETVSRYTGIEVDKIKSRKRWGEIVYARHLAFYFLANYSTLTLKNVGRQFGKYDHTSVIHGANKIEGQKKFYDDIKKDVDAIFHMLLSEESGTVQG